MSPTITNEVVQVEYVDGLARTTNMSLMVETAPIPEGSIQVSMNAQMQEMRGGMNG